MLTLCKQPLTMAPAAKKILIADDEPDILEFMSYNLNKEGFEVFTSTNGKDAIRIATQEKPSLIILDVMMPDLDGIETCRVIRETPELKEVLVAFLTARNEDYSQIAGFDAGADDYINKPIKPRVMVSRVKALLRRAGKLTGGDEVMEVNGFTIDREKYLIVKDNVQINLPKKEFELIALLEIERLMFTSENCAKNWEITIFALLKE